MSTSALIVFARTLEPGTVKTRLGLKIGEDNATTLYEAFVLDALHSFQSLGVPIRLYLAGRSEYASSEWREQSAGVFEQSGEGLGMRMKLAFAESFAAGYENLVIVGTDFPTLPVAYLDEAFTHIDQRSPCVAIGPCQDGGYYALGLNQLYSSLFDSVSFGRSDVFSETVKRVSATSAELVILPEWYDVDNEVGLHDLISELAMIPDTAPRTRSVLRDMGMLS